MSWSQIGSTENCRIAASPPSQGGVITSTFLELLIYPIIFFMWRSRVSHDLDGVRCQCEQRFNLSVVSPPKFRPRFAAMQQSETVA